MKVAMVDMVRVLDQTKLGLAGAKALQVLHDTHVAAQRPLAEALDAHKNRPHPARQQLAELQQRQTAEREEKRTELRASLLAKLRPILDATAQKHDVDFVLAAPQVLLYARPELDLTGEVIAELDRRHPA